MRPILILALLTLAACGADGEPIRPSANATLSAGSGGIGVSTGVTIRKGPFTVAVSS